MIIFLRALFVLVIASMLWVTSWASVQCPLFAIPREVFAHPWFIATMADAYWGFLTFFVWVCYQQTNWLARLAWLVAILLLGNIAMAAYCLAQLLRVSSADDLSSVLTHRTDRVGWLGPLLAILGCAVVAGALAAH